MLVRERKRADRSHQSLVLVLTGVAAPKTDPPSPRTLRAISDAFSEVKRETDVVGWFEKNETIGLIVPELSIADPYFVDELHGRIRAELRKRLDAESINRVFVRLHVHWGRSAVETRAVGAAESNRERASAAQLAASGRRGCETSVRHHVERAVARDLLAVVPGDCGAQ